MDWIPNPQIPPNRARINSEMSDSSSEELVRGSRYVDLVTFHERMFARRSSLWGGDVGHGATEECRKALELWQSQGGLQLITKQVVATKPLGNFESRLVYLVTDKRSLVYISKEEGHAMHLAEGSLCTRS